MALRVLVVDDNPIARSMLSQMLTLAGHQSAGETTGLKDTLEALKTSKPDIVALDLSLTQQDGLTVLKAIRQIDRQVKVLIVTGNSQKKLHEELLAAGASGFLIKPFHVHEVKEAIAQVIPA